VKSLATRYVKRPALSLLCVIGVCVAGGLVYAAFAGKDAQKSVAYAMFIVGGALVVLAGISGGGGRGSRADVYETGRYQPADMPFGWVVIGALVIGIGVLVLKV
jgi:hypothetical protein